jgi:PAS domain S-box-containing protein/putative nucleotidyltransferase with HDIG domain
MINWIKRHFEKTLIYKKTLEQKVEERTSELKDSEEKYRHLSEELEHLVERRTERLHKSLRYWKDTFDATPYGIFIIDKEYRILRMNRYITQLLGKTYEEIEGKKCYEVFHGMDRPVIACPLEKALSSGGSESVELYEPTISRYLWIHVTPVIHEGKVDTFIHSIIDITDIKEKESNLEKSRDAFLNMLRDIHDSYENLKELFISLIRAFVHALDAKSPWTKGHSERVAMYAVAIAEELSMGKEEIEDLNVAALLHDIGKIGTYDYLLDKPERLTTEEFQIVQRHPATAIEILSDIKQLKEILPIIRHHHERFDGNGYPDGLEGDEIPLGARILCVADSFDSMTADRPYRPSPGTEYAKLEFERCSGTQFDPKVTEAFLKVLNSTTPTLSAEKKT